MLEITFGLAPCFGDFTAITVSWPCILGFVTIGNKTIAVDAAEAKAAEPAVDSREDRRGREGLSWRGTNQVGLGFAGR